MPDADDFTRCSGCDCSLCLITGAYHDTCLECYNSICWECQIKHGMRKKPEKKDTNRYGVSRHNSEPEDFLEPYVYVHEDTYDEEIIKLFDEHGEPGFIGGCPFCDKISDTDLLEYLIEQSGMSRKEIETEFKKDQ